MPELDWKVTEHESRAILTLHERPATSSIKATITCCDDGMDWQVTLNHAGTDHWSYDATLDGSESTLEAARAAVERAAEALVEVDNALRLGQHRREEAPDA